MKYTYACPPMRSNINEFMVKTKVKLVKPAITKNIF